MATITDLADHRPPAAPVPSSLISRLTDLARFLGTDADPQEWAQAVAPSLLARR